MSGPFGSSQWMYNPGGDFYGYEIDNSLRFVDFGDNNGSNHYLSRTPSSSGSSTTWTWSAWVKRGTNLGTPQHLFSQWEYPPNNQHRMFFGSDDRLTFMLYNGSSNTHLGCKTPEAILRDVGAWYHIVFVWDTTNGTADDRMRVYINGERQTTFASTGGAGQSGSINPSSSLAGYVNNTGLHTIGTFRDPSLYSAFENFDGYMAEINFIDGTALDASSFGETKSGIWIPKAYSGSYGTNGFHLEFSGNANDSSGNANNWTTSGISSHDYMPDSPTNNFANLMIHNNPAANSNAFSQGNLRFTPGTGDSARNTNRMAISNMLVGSGKWYAEVYVVDNASGQFIGVGPKQTVSPTANNTRYAYIYGVNGQSYVRTGASEVISTYAGSYTVGDVLGIYIDMDAATPVVYFSKNGQWSNGSGSWNQSSPSGGITLGGTFFTESADFSGTITFQAARSSGTVSPTTIWNFGQDDTFTGNITAGGNADANGYGSFKYAPPTNALALCTANLPAPAIDPAVDASPEDYFDTVLYTAASSNGTYDIGNASFVPDFTWIKNRNNVEEHYLFDVVRGNSSITNKFLNTNSTDAEGAGGVSGTTVTSQLGGMEVVESSINSGELYYNSRTYAMFNWKAGGSAVTNTDGSQSCSVSADTDSGFSVVKWTASAASGTLGHGLSTAPDLIIAKPLASSNWFVQFRYGMTAAQVMNLESTSGAYTPGYAHFQSTLPTSSVFYYGGYLGNGFAGTDKVAYCFASKEGYSKIGSYTGNSSNDGTFIYTGFRPAWIMIKRTDSTNNWYIFNNKTIPYNSGNAEAILKANTVDAESDSLKIDLLSNGFKPRDASPGFNTGSYVYLAFAEQPFKYANAR